MRNPRPIDIVGVAVACSFIAIAALGMLRRNTSLNDRTECYYNLRCLYGSYFAFQLENGRPMTQVSTNFGGSKEYGTDANKTYMVFRNLVARNVANDGVVVDWLCCPKDTRVPAPYAKVSNTNISYFISVNAPKHETKWILMGNRNLVQVREDPGDKEPTKWRWRPSLELHGGEGFVMLLGGEIMEVSDHEVDLIFQVAGNNTNAIAFP